MKIAPTRLNSVQASTNCTLVQRQFNNDSGFSLLQLLSGLAIFLTLVSLTIPHFTSAAASMKRLEARESLNHDLKRAQAASRAEGTRGIIQIGANGNSYSFGFDYPPYSSSPAVPDTVRFVRALPKGITITASQTAIFSSSGQLIDEIGIPTSTTATLSENGTSFVATTIYPTGATEF